MFMIFGYFSYIGYHVRSITVDRFVSTDTHRPMTLWPRRLLTLHTGLRRGVHKSQAPFAMATVFSTVAQNICGFLVWDLLQVTLLLFSS